MLERKYGLTQVVVEPAEDELEHLNVSQSIVSNASVPDLQEPAKGFSDEISLKNTGLNDQIDSGESSALSVDNTAFVSLDQKGQSQEVKKEFVDGFLHHLSASLSFLFSVYFFLAVFFAQGSSESSLVLLFRSTLESGLFLCVVFGVLSAFVILHWVSFAFLEKIVGLSALFLVLVLLVCLTLIGVGGWFFFLLHILYFPLLLLFGLFCFEEFGPRGRL